MLRLFMFCCVLADVTSTLASFGSDVGRIGVASWLGLNALLIVLPLAIRAAEPLLSAWADCRAWDVSTRWQDAQTAGTTPAPQSRST